MGSMVQMLGGTCFFVSLFCFGFVVYKMYTEGDTVMAIVCGVGFLACGIGYLIAFVYGWMKSNLSEIKPIMLVWSCSWGLSFILNIVVGMLTGG